MASREAIEASFKKAGIPMASPDDPVYSEGPQMHFLSPTSNLYKQRVLGSTTPDGKKSTKPLPKSDKT